MIASIMCRVAADAQVYDLKSKDIDGDPLLGKESCTAWVGGNVCIYEYKNGKASIVLSNHEMSDIFVKGAIVFGYYSSSDSLLYSGKCYTAKIAQGSCNEYISYIFAEDSIPFSTYSDNDYVVKRSWRALSGDILRWMKETDGYLRIVAPMYGNHKFDRKIRIKKDD